MSFSRSESAPTVALRLLVQLRLSLEMVNPFVDAEMETVAFGIRPSPTMRTLLPGVYACLVSGL